MTPSDQVSQPTDTPQKEKEETKVNKTDNFIVDLNDEIVRLLQLDFKQRTRRAEETFSDQPELKKQIMDILDNLNLSLEFAYMQVGMLLDPYTH